MTHRFNLSNLRWFIISTFALSCITDNYVQLIGRMHLLLGFRSDPLKYFFIFRHLSLPQRENGNTTQRTLPSPRFSQSLCSMFVFSSFERVRLYRPYLKEFFCSPLSMTVIHFCWQGRKLCFATASFIFHSFIWFSNCSEET